AMEPAIDRAAGPARAAVRVAVGTREYDSIRESVAQEAAEYTMVPFRDPEFSRRQSDQIRRLVAQRTRELPSADYVEMLRAAYRGIGGSDRDCRSATRPRAGELS